MAAIDRPTLEMATAACLRTLARQPGLQVSFGRAGHGAVCLPDVHDAADSLAISHLRGASDAAACHLRFGVSEAFKQERPAGRAGEVFDVLLAARSEALGARWLAGVSSNLAGHLRSASGPASRLHSATYAAFRGQAARHEALARLAKLIDDEGQFVRAARDVCAELTSFLGREEMSFESPEVQAADKSSGEHQGDASAEGEPNELSSGAQPGAWPAQLSEGYRVYTRRFDETVEAHRLASLSELDGLRARLDSELVPHRPWIARLARRLQRHIQTRQSRHWALDQEEGQLDPSRLARVIVDASFDTPFRRELESRFADTVVSLLVDNSGSMRGRPIAIAALTTDILARTLERCGVKVEILGFTTVETREGRAWRQWVREGKPPEPGRLNAVRHIVYKAADTPWRRARRSLGLLLKDDILKENIDGEALWWAYQRLATRPEPRRVLLVISDGSPVDESTLAANGREYLQRHLRRTIQWIERHSRVELAAIGIGHDVRRYYERAVVIGEADELGEALIESLRRLFV